MVNIEKKTSQKIDFTSLLGLITGNICYEESWFQMTWTGRKGEFLLEKIRLQNSFSLKQTNRTVRT